MIRNKLFSVINILGLAIGITTFFVIMLYVEDELSYDKFNVNADRIARVIFQAEINGGKINESVTMAPVAQTMKSDFPDVEDATRLLNQGKPKVNIDGKIFREDKLALVDPNFFAVFTLPVVAGDMAGALAHPNGMVITESMARKYFGNEAPVGKQLKFEGNNTLFEVTAVLQDVPANSHFHFDLFGSLTGYEEAKSDSWMSGGFHTYLLFKPGARLEVTEARLPDMVVKYMGPQIQQHMGLSLEQFQTKGNTLGFALQPLTSIHLHSATSNEHEPGGSATYVYIFAGVAFFMLLVVCINFVNLSTAGASRRAREIGVRKVIGSDKAQLIRQFLSESVLLAALAMVASFALLYVSLPTFERIAGKVLTINWQVVVVLVGVSLTVGVLAGLYPAFYLSSFKPVAALKGKLRGGKSAFSLRSSLVVFQFCISVILLVGTIVVYQQIKFIQKADLGYSREQVVIIPNSWALGKNERLFKDQMAQDRRVVSATLSWYRPADSGNYNNALAYPADDSELIVNGVDYYVDENYIPTLGMQMSAGRNFSPATPTDSSGIILNETAAQAMGWDAETALGKVVVRQNSSKGVNYPFRVIGVVKNFHFKSLHEAISPLFMTLDPQGGLIFKVEAQEVAGLLADMQAKWEGFETGEPFAYTFMDELYDRTYATERTTATSLNVFALLTILVACLGLFGLATYAAEQRTREIGIRKVLGAGTGRMVGMLSGEFLRYVLAGSVIAFPVASWGMNKWLESFAYRIEIQWWMFAGAGLAAVSIALLTVSWQAIRAAVANPVESLRNE